MWNVVTDKVYMNRDRIFPTQQDDVGSLVEAYKEIPEIERVVIFGSSVTSACNPWSDIDVYVVMSREVHVKSPKLPVSVDLWTNFDVDDRLTDEINEKGVVVYER